MNDDPFSLVTDPAHQAFLDVIASTRNRIDSAKANLFDVTYDGFAPVDDIGRVIQHLVDADNILKEMR